VAAGATTNTFGIPGVEQHGFPLYNLDDATALRNHVLERFEAADADPSLVDDGALTFVVVGGGPTGVEVAGALTELFHLVLRKDFRRLDGRPGPGGARRDAGRPAGAVPPASRRHARETLEERGVEVRTGVQVARVRSTRVASPAARSWPPTPWSGRRACRANPVGAALGLPTGRAGRIVVEPTWRWRPAAGVGHRRRRRHRGSDGGRSAAPAGAGGDAVGRHVAARSAAGEGRRRRTRPFRYRDKGTMATIGRSRAVAELPLGITLRGFPAWLAWLGLHLVMLAGFRNRISVFANWAWNWLDLRPRPAAHLPEPPRPMMRSTAISMATRSARSPGWR
jgi:NADH:ubiquinone reductase (H+-translocating)